MKSSLHDKDNNSMLAKQTSPVSWSFLTPLAFCFPRRMRNGLDPRDLLNDPQGNQHEDHRNGKTEKDIPHKTADHIGDKGHCR